MNVAVRPGWVLPHLALSGLTAAVVAASSFGAMGTLTTIDLTQLKWPFAATAITPELAGPPQVPAAPPFVLHADAAEARQAVRCLAQAVYFEAGFQPVEGKRAVAQVIVNRVRDRDFPKTVCGVVYEGSRRRSGCQFSFACDGSVRRRPPTADELASAEQIARDALGGYVMAAVGTGDALPHLEGRSVLERHPGEDRPDRRPHLLPVARQGGAAGLSRCPALRRQRGQGRPPGAADRPGLGPRAPLRSPFRTSRSVGPRRPRRRPGGAGAGCSARRPRPKPPRPGARRGACPRG